MDLHHTANQPIGPFYHFALTPNNDAGIMAGPEAKGERVDLAIRLLDADGKPVTNGMIELWQASAAGVYNDPADPAFHGFGRLATDREGLCLFHTVKPGQVAGLDGKLQAPHIDVSVYAPGLTKRVVARIYFADDPANDADQVLGLAPEHRRQTMLARKTLEPGRWNFDLYLCGPCETVFFDI